MDTMKVELTGRAGAILDLAAEIRDVLLKMRYVSEGSSGSAPDADKISHGYESSVPTGATIGRRDPRDQPLYDRYVQEFQALLWRAQNDLDKRRKRAPGRGAETREERNARIVAMYVGWPAGRVAVYEDLSITQIRTIREDLGYTAHEGLKREVAA